MELEDLEQKKSTFIKSKIYDLSPYLDDNGIIRMNEMLKLAPYLEEFQKNLIIVNHNHEFTELLITRYQEKIIHVGLDTVINEIRTTI